jgi:hypothetical protein
MTISPYQPDLFTVRIIISAMASLASASRKVLLTVELLEQILCSVPQFDLVQARRTCTVFKNVIDASLPVRRHLFFETTSWEQFSIEMFRWNNGVVEKFNRPLFAVNPLLIQPGNASPLKARHNSIPDVHLFVCPKFRRSLFRDDHQMSRDVRQMLVTDPPSTLLFIRLQISPVGLPKNAWKRVQGASAWVNNDVGVRVGDVISAAEAKMRWLMLDIPLDSISIAMGVDYDYNAVFVCREDKEVLGRIEEPMREVRGQEPERGSILRRLA